MWFCVIYQLRLALVCCLIVLGRCQDGKQHDFCDGNCNRNAYCDADQVTCKCVDGYLDMSPVGTTGKICLPITSVGCPPSWETLEGTTYCYRMFSKTGISRDQAARRCQQEMPSAKLATIPSNIITLYAGNTADSAISTIGSHKKTWIGLMFDAEKKAWVWPDGNVANFTGWFYGSGPEDPVQNNQLCAQLIGGPYGHGSWIPADCSGAKNKSEADGFMCSKPRKLPPNERPLASHKSFEITCCKNGTPRVDADIQDLVSDWVVNDLPQAVSYDDSCWRYAGSFMLDEGSLLPHQDPSVKCQCPQPGLDSGCNEVEECVNGYRSYKIGLRCSCQEPFFGKLCDLMCENGDRKKDDNGSDVCVCFDYYYGIECNKIQCLNDGIAQENQRSCKCVSEQFTGRHCEFKHFNGDIQNFQYRNVINRLGENNSVSVNSASIDETQSGEIYPDSQQRSNSSEMITNDSGVSQANFEDPSNVNGGASNGARGSPVECSRSWWQRWKWLKILLTATARARKISARSPRARMPTFHKNLNF